MDKRHTPQFLVKAVFLLAFGLTFLSGITPEELSSNSVPFTWNLLWTGSWTRNLNLSRDELSPELMFSGGTLINRGEIRLGLPNQHLNLRVQGIDRRVVPGEEATINPGLGLYFDGARFLGRSRLLYGVLEEYGLPARIRNVWAKSPPYSENRRLMISDLRRDPSTNKPETYLYLGLPQFDLFQLGLFNSFVAAQADDEFNLAFGSGFDFRSNRNTNFRLETFYTQKLLESRDPRAWFSLAAPLPEREFRLFALGTALDTRNYGFAADMAYSETFAWGRDIYGNAALRLGSRPWRLSLSAEGSGSRYVGRDGNILGQGFRLAGRVERQWIRSGLFRLNTIFRAPGLGEDFERASFNVYFRPSAPPGRAVPLFRFSRASIHFSRNAVNPLKTEDSLDLMAAFNFRTLRTVFTGSLNSQSVFENKPFPLPIPPSFQVFDSAKISGELAWNIKALQLRYKMGYMIRAEKDPIWDFSLNAALRIAKLGRVSLRIAAPEFPDKWTYGITYRMELSSRS